MVGIGSLMHRLFFGFFDGVLLVILYDRFISYFNFDNCILIEVGKYLLRRVIWIIGAVQLIINVEQILNVISSLPNVIVHAIILLRIALIGVRFDESDLIEDYFGNWHVILQYFESCFH